MGCLTGAEIVHYGADDAITCVSGLPYGIAMVNGE